MKEDKKFKIWKLKKYKLDKYKSIGLFNLLNINKKEKKELLNLKIKKLIPDFLLKSIRKYRRGY